MINPAAELLTFARAALISPVPDGRRPAPGELRRRRLVVGVTLVVGAVLLAATLRIPAGDPYFYLSSLLLAAVWTAGAFASGPLQLGQARTRSGGVASPIVQSLALAALLVGLFLAGAVGVAHVDFLRGPVDQLLDHARFGSLPLVLLLTLINGVGEELYFRGALFAAFEPRHAVALTTIVYTLTTIATGVPLLVLAAAFLGLICGLQRRVTGGVLGPLVVHICWSGAMLLLLPIVLEAMR